MLDYLLILQIFIIHCPLPYLACRIGEGIGNVIPGLLPYCSRIEQGSREKRLFGN
jgi:hypothetical protein